MFGNVVNYYRIIHQTKPQNLSCRAQQTVGNQNES